MAKVPFERSSGNVFADIGFAPAEAAELTAKSSLIIAIKDTIEERSFAVMEQRRELAEIVQGTREELSRNRISVVGLGGMSQRDEINYLLGRTT